MTDALARIFGSIITMIGTFIILISTQIAIIINGHDLLCEEFGDTKMSKFLIYQLFAILTISLHSLFLFVLFHIGEKYEIQHFFLFKKSLKAKISPKMQ